MDKSLIQIFRGDDTDGLGYQSIQGKITTTLDLTGCRAVFRYLGFTQEFDPIPENGRITITIPASKTSKFPPGLGYASLRVYDSEGKVRTFTNRIPVFVTVYAPSECGGEFEVVFNGGNLELEPLKIKSVNGYRIYDGYLEQIIDKATATEYGLALLFDGRDSAKDANSGYAATPKAVQAAYDAIIQELTDNYYNAEETDEAIDRIAAYYITADAQGNPFATHAALMNATVYYSGGEARMPTRNDYSVVLADETHGGKQYRYIYAVNQQGVGQWEAQYAVGGSVELDNTVTRTSANGVKSSGIWSALWGSLTALLPGITSLHDWVKFFFARPIAIAPKWDADHDYHVGDVCIESELIDSSGLLYRCIKSYRTDSESNDPSLDTEHWEEVDVKDLLDGKLGNTGTQTLSNGLLWVKNGGIDIGDYGTEFPLRFTAMNGVTRLSMVGGELWYGRVDQGDPDASWWWPGFGQIEKQLARISNIYTAIQQIAPDFTAKVYAANELCSYNGVVYRCKSTYTATASSTKPNSDTTHWEAKKVSELFLPITGGTMEGSIRFRDGNFKEEYDSYRKWYLASLLGVLKLTSTDNNTILFPVASGTLALLSDTMRFSTAVSYAVGDVVFYNGAFYRCAIAHTAGAWNASHFAEVIGGLSTGTPTAPTPTASDNSTKVATTAFVQTAISGISVTPLSGQTFNFATTQGVMDALKTVIEALGGTVTNAPSLTISQGE